MGFAGLTASETARRCEGPWRRGCVLQGFLAYRSTRRNPFARPASAGGLLAVFWRESASIPHVPKYASSTFRAIRTRQSGPRCLRGESASNFSRTEVRVEILSHAPHPLEAFSLFSGRKHAPGFPSRKVPGRSACQELPFLLLGAIFEPVCNDTGRSIITL